jgi:hypothetical protein
MKDWSDKDKEDEIVLGKNFFYPSFTRCVGVLLHAIPLRQATFLCLQSWNYLFQRQTLFIQAQHLITNPIAC